MIKIYDISDKRLYEIIEDYRDATDKEKEEIMQVFSAALWNSANKRTFKTITVSFSVDEKFKDTKIGTLFEKYSVIRYRVPQTRTKSDSFIDLIRQRINNIYSIYFDHQALFSNEYRDLMTVPAKLYYRYRENPDIYTAEEIKTQINSAFEKAERIKDKNYREKMNIPWEEYKELITSYLHLIFKNYRSLDELDETAPPEYFYANENSRITQYICKSLSGYIKNYQKSYYGLKPVRGAKYSRCRCGALFMQNKQNNRKMCNACRDKNRKESFKKYNKKRKTTQLKSS